MLKRLIGNYTEGRYLRNDFGDGCPKMHFHARIVWICYRFSVPGTNSIQRITDDNYYTRTIDENRIELPLKQDWICCQFLSLCSDTVYCICKAYFSQVNSNSHFSALLNIRKLFVSKKNL